MLLMAWAGDVVTIKDNGLSEGLRFQQLLLTCGVIHNDMRQENLLWNSERGHLLLIDFDLATILPDMRQTQLKRLSKKRKRHLRDPVTIKYSTGSNWYQQLIT
jgi:serine/threonine protein kinase